jgi:hypothetical protein
MTTEQFYEQIQSTLAEGRRPDALDIVFDFVEAHLLEGRFEPVREILVKSLSYTDQLPLSVFLSILCVTRPWRALFVVERTALADDIRPGAEDPACVDRLLL